MQFRGPTENGLQVVRRSQQLSWTSCSCALGNLTRGYPAGRPCTLDHPASAPANTLGQMPYVTAKSYYTHRPKFMSVLKVGL